jgi:ubiquinone/menaquinone biosynthesis C-methylase UbiE
LVQGTAVPLPFPDDTFDAITCLEALEFLPNSEAALREMVRTLKPSGVLMVSRRLGKEGKLFLNKYRSAEDIIALLEGMGLEEVNTQPWQIDYEQVFGKKI